MSMISSIDFLRRDWKRILVLGLIFGVPGPFFVKEGLDAFSIIFSWKILAFILVWTVLILLLRLSWYFIVKGKNHSSLDTYEKFLRDTKVR